VNTLGVMADAFDVLGVEARFDLDSARLQRAFLARSAELHPDRAAGDEVRAAALNQAREALRDPEQRANLLLARLGGPSKEADRSLPAGFLEAMMSARESLDAAKQAGSGDEVERWRAWAESERDGHMARVRGLFAEERPDAKAIRRELNAWRYIERMLEQVGAL
jgi:molecular chaperone HscB